MNYSVQDCKNPDALDAVSKVWRENCATHLCIKQLFSYSFRKSYHMLWIHSQSSEKSESLSLQFCKRRNLKFQYPRRLTRGMMWHVHTWMPSPDLKRNLSPGCFLCRSALKTGDEISGCTETFSVMTSCYFCVPHCWVGSFWRLQSLQILHLSCGDALNTYFSTSTSADLLL